MKHNRITHQVQKEKGINQINNKNNERVNFDFDNSFIDILYEEVNGI